MNSCYVATYNMSFSSDAGNDAQFASEATFLNKNNSVDRRLYWKNALALLKSFIIAKNPIAIGLQEMNLTTFGTDSGTNEIINMLTSLNKLKKKKYDCISSQVFSGRSFPALTIIYDTDRLGPVTKMKITSIIPKGGRPLMMVLTMNNTLLINIHGAQDPSLTKNMEEFGDYMQKYNVKVIQDEADKFLEYEDVNNIFVMGDFNDRYDAIKCIKIKNEKLTYKGESPYSCCHNWDSSCSDKRFVPFTNKKYGTCTVDTEWLKDKKKYLMETEGYVNNYRYKGDKVFGFNPIQKLKMLGDGNYSSIESDHELVYGKFLLK